MGNYPQNPNFHKLNLPNDDCRNWQEEMAHDPSLLEWEGRYYVYSTDTFGAPSGYQIRVSDDLVHWKYVGSAFPLAGAEKDYKNGKGTAGHGNLQEAYNWCVTEGERGICTHKDGRMGFWAPHCVRGTDGKFWLYFCLTGNFGGSRSCIGIAKSSSPEGGFVCEEILVKSPAGWRTPNAIDPQVFFAEDRMFLIYGSFGLGLHLLELDPQTGKRKTPRKYEEFANGECSFRDYYGVQIASGSVEGGVIKYHKNVPVIEGGKQVLKNYYYLMCSYGSLSSAYNIRCGRSETPEGPYLDGNGNRLVCSTDIGTGNKLLGSFGRKGEPECFCPGHNDMFTTKDGVNVLSMHCRTHALRKGNWLLHYLRIAQYAFNSEGWIVINSNRYACERLRAVSREELLNVSNGCFEAIRLKQNVETVEGETVRLCADGTTSGALCGKWELYGENYFFLQTKEEEYRGVVMPAWIEGQSRAGLTVSALGSTSGMALFLNSRKE